MLLGIDLGTGSAKALLLELDGTVIAEASSVYAVHAPKPGWAESHPSDWLMAVAIAVRAVMNDQREVQAIGLSGQMHGIVVTDEMGHPLHPAILWADTRSSEVLKEYRALSQKLQDQLANPITAGMAGPSLLWLRRHQPEIYASARWVFQPKDWLRFRLTGVAATEPSDASGTLLYDVMGDRWANGVLAALNLRSDWLPPLLPSSQIAGYLTAEASEILGLPIGLPIVAGAADTAAALLGSGLKPGLIQLTIGTAAQIVTLLPQPIADPHKRTHLYRAALPDEWYALAAMQNAGLALEWARSLLGLSWQQVYAEAATVQPGCEGLTFLPYLTGERTPHLDPDIRGAWVGLGLHHTRAHLMRSALEGVAFSLKQGLAAIAKPDRATELVLAGGGTLEPLWQQLLADVLQVRLHSLAVAAASARGAAVLAGLGVRVYPNIDAAPKPTIAADAAISPNLAKPELDAAWQRFQSLYPRLA